MIWSKINIYLLAQITKYLFLILFIFLSVSWLLQLTRLFTITNFMHIQILDIVLLSLYLIPNIITVITPFILIFGLLLCFIKLNKDNELIAILSLGAGLNPFRKTLIFFSIIIIFVFSLLNLFLAPIVYKQYKLQEYELRNTLDFKSMAYSNFLNLNSSTILDFKKNNNAYNDILISFTDEKENIVYAEKGDIVSKDNEYNFQLTNGFKISIDENKQIEKLEFRNYILKIENKNSPSGNIVDKNTLTIFEDIKLGNNLNITYKIFDVFLILFIFFLFYKNNLKKINFTLNNNIYFSIVCVSILIINQILKNSEIQLFNYFIIIISILCIPFLFSYIKKIYEQN